MLDEEARPILAAAASREEARPYPVARMVFQVLFLMTIGTIYGFSIWSFAFVGSEEKPGPFPSWTQTELGFVYSMGICGAFATPLGGFLYDWAGASPTYAVGASLVLLGWALISLIALSGAVPAHSTHLAVGVCYAVEELGSSTLYMGLLMDTLLNFPAKKVALSMGLVALGYSLSSVATALLVSMLQPDLWAMVSFISIVVPGLACVRVFILGPPAASAKPAETEPQAAMASGSVMYGQAMSTPAFRVLAANAVLVVAPSCSLMGFMKVVGDAVGVNGSTLATIGLVANCVGRIGVGFAYDQVRNELPSSQALLANEAVMALGFGMLWYGAESAQAWGIISGGLVVTFAVGGNAPIVGAYVKDSFEPGTSGLVLGVSQLCVACTNFVFIAAFGPSEVSRIASFSSPFFVSTAMCSLCVGMHFLGLGPRGQVGKVA